MPFDGIVVKNIVHELESCALNGRIDKIYQPTKEDIVLSLRAAGRALKVLISSSASFPRIHITNTKSENPQSPPMFCMILRKHIAGGKIIGISQPMLERIVEIHIEALNELGDISEKKLIIEIMGKHSNIILVNADGVIIDAVKRIGLDKSSVREVLPGKPYDYPPTQDKLNPLELSFSGFIEAVWSKQAMRISDAIYKSYCGISPLIATEICERAGVFPGEYIETMDISLQNKIFRSFSDIINNCRSNIFTPEIVYDLNNNVLDFSSVELTQFGSFKKSAFPKISLLLEEYYGKKATEQKIKQKTIDLRKLLQNNLERCVKKRDILDKTLRDTEKMEEWRLCGELLTSYLSLVQKGEKYFDAENYYNENQIKRIKLNPDLSPSQNANRYFEKYNKAKRQKKAVTEQLSQNEAEIQYLESVYSTVFNDITEGEIQEIRNELFEQGYIKKKPIPKGVKQQKTEPLHFVASDGSDIYVGKNNKQNDYLTLKLADFNDIWLHTKDIPGSHVILKTGGKEPSDAALNEATLLAAFYSRAKDGATVPVDYTEKRNVKKPSGAKPGVVIYEKNKTAYVTPLQEKIELIRKV